MSDKKRRWFQIHLSTAVVLMFVAGGLIWMNLAPREDRVRSQSYLSYGQWQVTIKGLPFVFLTEKNSSTINGAAKSTASEEVMLQGLQSFGLKDRKIENVTSFTQTALALNLNSSPCRRVTWSF